MYKNLLTLSLTAAFILQFNSQASAEDKYPNCYQSFRDLQAAQNTLQAALYDKCGKVNSKTGWSTYCDVNIDSDVEQIKQAAKKAYQDCSPGAAPQ